MPVTRRMPFSHRWWSRPWRELVGRARNFVGEVVGWGAREGLLVAWLVVEARLEAMLVLLEDTEASVRAGGSWS